MPAQREEQDLLQRGERDVDHQLRGIEREFATGFEAVARIGLPALCAHRPAEPWKADAE
jgi:hypothetical protein